MSVWSVVGVAVAVALGASILVGYMISGAPPVASGRAERRDLVDLLRQASPLKDGPIYELGAGWGGLAIAIARAFPDRQVVAFELSPLPCLVAKLRARGCSNLEVRWGNFLRADLSDAAAVGCYLLIDPMVPLAAKLDADLRADTPVVTVTFFFRGRVPVAQRSGPGLRGEVGLYRWRAG